MHEISTQELKRKYECGELFSLVDVLPQEQYNEKHLPGAINIPLDDHFDRNVVRALPDKTLDVVVYCQNAHCDASPEAARRLHQLGYEHVSDYADGKDAWYAQQ